ncbi:TAXI family TRAP transporter solute-binding subunit [Pseudaminobacter salicylatoxidans]|uniref:TAXI family TRAP transporter solute-binding subunit n=1 Tax=Pseudaminobacter salicylatoxidans TaxID=93369 RepID=UPI0002D79E47|nr:TAXI family TRAP transporter solute-binding subunit [Pseudaminobacter salicylatoxidans]
MAFSITRRAFSAGVGAAALLAGSGAAFAQQAFFRIGTGGTAGTYYPVGGLIANAISATGSSGVKDLVATAVASNGSVANISAIQSGAGEAGFTQSDVAYWAHSGTGLYEGKPKVEDLRLIATLYPETIHLVARADAGIKSVADLKGKRVSLDEPGSGTIVDARLVLAAYGLSEQDVKAEYLKPGPAGEKLQDNSLDAYFFVGGYPTGAIVELAATNNITLVPITGPEADKLLSEQKFFQTDTVPEGTYKNVPETKTISVAAQLVTSAKQADDLIYNITKSLYSEDTQKSLQAGHAKGKLITADNAVKSAGIPFHPGAERYYKETGLLK